MRPEVSVVMGVYNGAADLAATIDSVLYQCTVDLELIVVNDGSTDDTPIIAENFAARDERVRVVHLRRVGLTQALIAGCSLARGDLIARQDCGDCSLASRLEAQRSMFERQDVVLASVGARFIGPGGETLYDVVQTAERFAQGLSGTDILTLRGPSHHGATMFRKSAYDAVGGYRRAYVVAQDLDLWMRLSEVGACVAIPEILYTATLSAGSISHLRRAEQRAATETILACAKARRAGQSDAAIVEAWCARSNASIIVPDPSSFYHFLGGVLRAKDPGRAKQYYLRALRHSFWRPATWFRLAGVAAATRFRAGPRIA